MVSRVSTELKKETSFPPTDQLAIEEPLEIRLEYWDGGEFVQKSISITMRSPGHDFELAVGFLLTEGIIQRFGEIKQIRHCGPIVEGRDFQNIVRVELQPGVCSTPPPWNEIFTRPPVVGCAGRPPSKHLGSIIPLGWKFEITLGRVLEGKCY